MFEGQTASRANWQRVVLLALLYSLAACLAINSLVLTESIKANTDLWWHLRTGEWVVQHRAVPWTDPFSAYGMNKPWAAYSWLFEVTLYAFYRWLGLAGTVVYVLPILVALAVVLYRAIRRRAGGFVEPIALTSMALLAMARLYSVRPWLFTVLFFAIELDLLFRILVDKPEARDYRRLWLLPPLFALWANLHIQFTYGLAVLSLAATSATIEFFLRKRPGRVAEVAVAQVASGQVAGESSEARAAPAGDGNRGARSLARGIAPRTESRGVRTLWIITGVSFVAALVNPYSWRVYGIVLELMGERTPFRLITELRAPDFRSPLDYLVVMMALFAAFLLGRSVVRSTLFTGVLLASSTLISLRTVRDEWLIVVVALFIIAAGLRNAARPPVQLSRAQRLAAAVLSLVLIFAVAKARGLSNAALAERVAAAYPVHAAEMVRQSGLAGPLYNDFDWGGYLIWSLPNLPVSMDGRTNVHGDTRLERSVAAWNCLPRWNADSELASARLVMGQAQQPLSTALLSDPRYRLVYRDAVSVVFVRVNN